MRSMVEGARAVEKILKRQEKRRGKRPSHRTSCGPPIPAIAGRDSAPLFAGHDKMRLRG